MRVQNILHYNSHLVPAELKVLNALKHGKWDFNLLKVNETLN